MPKIMGVSRMWFRNLAAYRMVSDLNLSGAEVSEHLSTAQFTPCSKSDLQTTGFVQPVSHATQAFAHAVGDRILVTLCSEEKILPGAVINEELESKVRSIEERQNRKVGRKERKELKENVIVELAARAFTRKRYTRAMILPKAKLVLVDAAYGTRSEEIMEWIRKCILDLQVRPIQGSMSSCVAATQWVSTGESPAEFSIDQECELAAPEEDGALVKCVRQDVATSEVTNHIEAGKEVKKLAMTWSDKISFILCDDLSLRRLTMLDLLQEEAKEAQAVDSAEQFDANLVICADETTKLLHDVLEALGGEKAHA